MSHLVETELRIHWLCLDLCIFKHSLFEQLLVNSLLLENLRLPYFQVEPSDLYDPAGLVLKSMAELEIDSAVVEIVSVDLLEVVGYLTCVLDEFSSLVDSSWVKFLLDFFLLYLLLTFLSVLGLLLHFSHTRLESLNLRRMMILFVL